MAADDKKEEAQTNPAPKDISKMSTDELIKEYAAKEAALNTAVNRETAKQLHFPAPDEEGLKETENARAKKTETTVNEIRKKTEEEPFRATLEKNYRKIENMQNDPNEFQKEVDKQKEAFKGTGEKTAMLWHNQQESVFSLPINVRNSKGKFV